MEKKSPDYLTLTAFGLSVIIAGINFIAVRFSNDELPPFWGAAFRFALASLLLFGLIYLRKLPLPKGQALLGALIYGLLGFGASYAFVYWGLLKVPSGIASVIIALVPLLTFFLAVLHRLEKFRLKAMAGALFATVGIAFVFSEQLGGKIGWLSLLAMVAAALSIAETNVVVKWFPKPHPIAMNALAMATGSVMLFLISTLTGEPLVIPSLFTTWVALVYLVLIGSIVLFLLYLFVISRWTASAVSYQLVLAPLVTVPLASLKIKNPQEKLKNANCDQVRC